VDQEAERALATTLCTVCEQRREAFTCNPQTAKEQTSTGRFVMRFVGAITLSVLALSVSGAALAQDASVAGSFPTPATKAPAGKDRKTCRWETPTGSNMAESTCHTASEWAAIEAQHAAEVRSLQDSRGWSNNGH
jgi:hypothetical protein